MDLICKVTVLKSKNYYRSPHGFIVFLAVSIRTLCSQKPKKRKREVDRKIKQTKKLSIYNHAFILSPFQLLRTNQKQANLCGTIQANLYTIKANQIQSTVKPPLATTSSK